MNDNFCWLRVRSEVEEWGSEAGFLCSGDGEGGGVVGVHVAMSFGTGKLEHEGLKCRIDGIRDRLFG